MSCFAYRGPHGTCELLCEHLINTYRQASMRWETDALSQKISYVLRLEKAEVRECILLAALLHDIGKAAQKFQEECLKGICERFPQHYLVSAFYAHIVLCKAFDLNLHTENIISLLKGENGDREELISLLVLYPIAFHHYHQVQDYTSYKPEEITSPIHEVCRCCFEQIGELIASEFNVLKDVGKHLKDLPNILVTKSGILRSKIFVNNIHEVINRVGRPRSFLPPAIEAVTGIVNLCDGITARSSRGRRNAGRREEGAASL
ncbi:MAG: CRISPR-associated endonuclease Cas3'' [Thermofilaceae archaeon]